MTSFLREIGDIVSEKIGNRSVSFYTKGYNNLGMVHVVLTLIKNREERIKSRQS